jgi:hypothetical protein
VRATLHDELMRDAGFEVEPDPAVARRRDARRAALLDTMGAAAALGTLLVWVDSALFLLDRHGVTRIFAPRTHFLVLTAVAGATLLTMTLRWLMTRHEPKTPLTIGEKVASRFVGREGVELARKGRLRLQRGRDVR